MNLVSSHLLFIFIICHQQGERLDNTTNRLAFWDHLSIFLFNRLNTHGCDCAFRTATTDWMSTYIVCRISRHSGWIRGGKTTSNDGGVKRSLPWCTSSTDFQNLRRANSGWEDFEAYSEDRASSLFFTKRWKQNCYSVGTITVRFCRRKFRH